jgi:hypothetical protein
MKTVIRLHHSGHLTEQQLLIANKFARAPQTFRLAPTLFRFMYEVIVEGQDIERLEKARGWPPRSAKLLLSQLLFALQEVKGMGFGDLEGPIDREMDDVVDHLIGADVAEIVRLKRKYKASLLQTRLLLIFLRDRSTIPTEALLSRLYADKPEVDIPDISVLNVHIHKLRKLIAKDFRIELERGVGYRLVPVEKEVAA